VLLAKSVDIDSHVPGKHTFLTFSVWTAASEPFFDNSLGLEPKPNVFSHRSCCQIWGDRHTPAQWIWKNGWFRTIHHPIPYHVERHWSEFISNSYDKRWFASSFAILGILHELGFCSTQHLL